MPIDSSGKEEAVDKPQIFALNTIGRDHNFPTDSKLGRRLGMQREAFYTDADEQSAKGKKKCRSTPGKR
jgi:hypothetical protein